MKEKGATFKRMMSLYEPHKGLLCYVLFGVILESAIDLAWPVMTRYILNDLLGTGDFSRIKDIFMKCGISLVILMTLNVYSQWILSYKASVLTDEIKYGLQNSIFNKYMNMSFSYFDNSRAGTIMSMIDYDVNKVDEFIYTFMTKILTVTVTMIGAMLIFSSISMKIMAMILPLLIVLFVFTNVHGKYLYKAFSKMREKDKKRIEEAEDKIFGVRTVISFGREIHEEAHFKYMSDEAKGASKKAWHHIWIRNVSAGVLFDDLYYIILLCIGGWMTFRGTLSLADLTIFLMYSYMLSNPIKDFVSISKSYSKAKSSFDNICEFLDTKSDIVPPKQPMTPFIYGDITFDNCTFKYECSEDNIIENFNLTIEAGKHTAIVGPSGSGKSTLAGLIPRYYDVTEGNVTISGMNVKDCRLHILRQYISVVQQDIYLFYGSIYDNIAYGRDGVDDIDVINAAKKANAHDFICKLPNGYNSNIGDRGVKLSGGQKQRIAIARAIVMNPAIIIFDEATSSLDNESEKEVQKAIDNIAGSVTTITIAHRLSTIRNADEIIYLSKNGVEERGTHKELMEKNGKYATLYNASERVEVIDLEELD